MRSQSPEHLGVGFFLRKSQLDLEEKQTSLSKKKSVTSIFVAKSNLEVVIEKLGVKRKT